MNKKEYIVESVYIYKDYQPICNFCRQAKIIIIDNTMYINDYNESFFGLVLDNIKSYRIDIYDILFITI